MFLAQHNFQIFLLIIIGFMSGCNADNASIEVLTTPEPIPNYLGQLVPMPNEHYIPANQGEAFICFYLYADKLIEQNDKSLKSETIIERGSLFLDGQSIGKPYDYLDLLGLDSNFNNFGPFRPCWLIKDVSVGRHTLEYQTQTTSGKINSYKWQFYFGTPKD